MPFAVLKKFGDDQGGNLAGLIAFRAFFSLFPLLLLLTTVLGYVLGGNADLRQEAVDSVLTQFPVIGEQVQVSSLEGNGVALAIGIAGSLWAGFGVVLATEHALDRVWAVPYRDRPDFLTSRLRALVLLVVLGTLTIASTIASGLVGGGSGLLGPVGGIAISVGINLLVFGALFWLLGAREASFWKRSCWASSWQLSAGPACSSSAAGSSRTRCATRPRPTGPSPWCSACSSGSTWVRR